MSDKDGLVDLARGLDGLGFELVSTGGTARTMREAGLTVTDVSAVTGSPEMLDGRVKTLHPRIHGGVLADLRLPQHRGQLAHANIDPFQVVAVNLYPFADAAARPGIDIDALIEEIDIGGPTLVRAAAKNHANVAILTDRRQYPGVLAELDAMARYPRDAPGAGARRVPPDGRLRRDDRRRSWVAGSGRTAAVDAPDRFPARLELALERAAMLRYGENPHQGAALYVVPGADRLSGPLAAGATPLQGKPLSYNNLLDAAAAAGLARDLRGAALVIVKHGNPCGAAEADDLVAAWQGALSGDPVSAFGGVVAVKGVVDRALAERLAGIFLEVVVACAFDTDALAILGRKTDLRLLAGPGHRGPADGRRGVAERRRCGPRDGRGCLRRPARHLGQRRRAAGDGRRDA